MNNEIIKCKDLYINNTLICNQCSLIIYNSFRKSWKIYVDEQLLDLFLNVEEQLYHIICKDINGNEYSGNVFIIKGNSNGGELRGTGELYGYKK